jgi:predicted MarR family transcription regulator
MAAAGQEDLGRLDGLVLHSVNHRSRDKKLADICFMLNVEDAHTVSYSLKKLVRLGLVEGTRRGKEIHYSASDTGREACERYRQVREDCLVAAIKIFAGQRENELNREVGELADLLRALSGIYDQAARAATSL